MSDLFKGEAGGYSAERIVMNLIEECKKFEVADQLGVFNKPALRVMVANAIEIERASSRGYDMCSRMLKPLWDFGLTCTLELAEDLVAGTDLVGEVVRKLKSESATGILDQPSLFSRWAEIVCDLQSNDSLLSEGFRRDIDSAVYEVFYALPRTRQFAVWVTHEQIRADWDDPPRGWEEGGFEGFELHELNLVLEDVTESVLEVARAEAEEMAAKNALEEESDGDEEDELF